MSAPSLQLVRRASFSASHRYWNPELSEAENRKLYGSLYRDEGFGHNFLVEAAFEGTIDPLTGMIVNLADIDRWLKEVLSTVDHKHLNALVEFKDIAPTPERIALLIFSELEKRVLQCSGVRLARVRVREGDHLWVDCLG